MQKQKEWSKSAKDPAVMIDIYLNAGEFAQAIETMGKVALSSVNSSAIYLARANSIRLVMYDITGDECSMNISTMF